MGLFSEFIYPEKKYPICIIGAGGIVKDAHLPAYKIAGFPVHSIVDKDKGRALALATQFSIPYYFDSVGEMVANAPDDAIFDVALPASAFPEIIARLPNQSAVLLQKPMGENIAAAQAIVDLCEKKQMLAAVNFQMKFAPQLLAIKELIDSGLLGEITDVEVRINLFTPWHMWDFLKGIPRMEILYHSVHYIDLISFLLGMPKSVYAKTVRHPLYPDLASVKSRIILDYGDLCQAGVSTHHSHSFGEKNQESFFKVEGTKSAAKWTIGVLLDYPHGKEDHVEWFDPSSNSWETIQVNGTWFPHAFIATMGGLFAKKTVPDIDLPHSVQNAYHTMVIVEAAYTSSEKGGIPL